MNRKMLILSLFLLALGAFLLHFRIHPVTMRDSGQISFTGLFAAVIIMLDILFVPYLLSYKDKAVYGYILNGMIAILGIIIMAHLSLSKMQSFTPYNLIFNSTFADIIIALADFLISKVIYDSYFVKSS